LVYRKTKIWGSLDLTLTIKVKSSERHFMNYLRDLNETYRV